VDNVSSRRSDSRRAATSSEAAEPPRHPNGDSSPPPTTPIPLSRSLSASARHPPEGHLNCSHISEIAGALGGEPRRESHEDRSARRRQTRACAGPDCVLHHLAVAAVSSHRSHLRRGDHVIAEGRRLCTWSRRTVAPPCRHTAVEPEAVASSRAVAPHGPLPSSEQTLRPMLPTGSHSTAFRGSLASNESREAAVTVAGALFGPSCKAAYHGLSPFENDAGKRLRVARRTRESSPRASRGDFAAVTLC
jgi:hypothetical protein